MTAPRLGRVQHSIMRVLWERGEATAREITDTLHAKAPIAHSTVQTLLRKLQEKGAVAHRTEGRTFIFYPRIQPEKATKSATREFVDRVFSGSAGGAVAFLLKHERLSRKELERIRALIEEKEERK